MPSARACCRRCWRRARSCCPRPAAPVPATAVRFPTAPRSFRPRRAISRAAWARRPPGLPGLALQRGRRGRPHHRSQGGAAMNQHGRVWRVGADIDTDALAPGAYMKFGIDEIARHCLQRVRRLRRRRAARRRAGGRAELRHRLLARTGRRRPGPAGRGGGGGAVHNGLYFRNAFNVGLLLLTCPHAARLVEGERVSLDPDAGRIHRRDGEALACEPLPDFLLDMVRAGGLLNQLKALQRSAATGRPGSGQCHRILTNRNCHHARPRHPGRAQRPAGTDRRRNGRDPVPQRLQSHHRRGARRLPRPVRRRQRRHAGAGQVRPAGVRGRHVLRGPGRRPPPRRVAACGTATSGS